ncbi:BrnA antitoxin family protein [Tabrizicola sp. YIM 78059]|uniref:BrnA antitoxin family protein n=1 Tax=Tabrizicola sp. YIM 78059 TaxID=2529861 RepID=UPI0010A9A10D|nr:BrnA antitoxin family protein [Tabrizicola sp. YIM 78059]
MPDLRKLTPRQAAQMTYMMDVMRHPKWDLHNSIEMTGRIPAEWHEIAQKRPTSGKEKVTLRLEADVLKFCRSMGPDYGPRINDVLRSYMHARLAGVIRGAETISHYRNRGAHDGPKPGFEGEEGKPVEADRVALQEALQRRYAEEGPPEVEALRPWVR